MPSSSSVRAEAEKLIEAIGVACGARLSPLQVAIYGAAEPLRKALAADDKNPWTDPDPQPGDFDASLEGVVVEAHPPPDSQLREALEGLLAATERWSHFNGVATAQKTARAALAEEKQIVSSPCLMCGGRGRRLKEGSWSALETCPRCKGTGHDPEPGSYVQGGMIRPPKESAAALEKDTEDG